MSVALKTKVIRVGNSQGVLIPKTWIKQLDLNGDVEMTIEEEKIIVQKSSRLRDDWRVKFEKAIKGKESEKIDFLHNSFDDKEWEWK